MSNKTQMIIAKTFLTSIMFLFIVSCGDNAINSKRDGVYRANLQTPVIAEKRDHRSKSENVYVMRRWRIDVPYKYIYSHRGSNKNQKANSDFFYQRKGQAIKIFARIDESGHVVALDAMPRNYNLILVIGSGSPSKRKPPLADCWNYEQRLEILGLDRGEERNRCSGNLVFCATHMHMDGWPVRISMDREIYEADPKPVCDIAREFLDSLTVSRESLLAVK